MAYLDRNRAVSFALLTILGCAVSFFAQQSKTLDWQGLIGKEDEFIFVIPKGYQIIDDGSYNLGDRDRSIAIKNSRNISRCVNGTVLMVDVLEGRGDEIYKVYTKRFPDQPGDEITAGNFTIRSYIKKTPDFTVEQQYIYNSRSLYVVTAGYRGDRPSLVETFFKTYRLVNDGAVVFPKGIKESVLNVWLTPVTVDRVATAIESSPDAKAVLLHRPKPAHRREFMKSNSGIVSVKALLSANGSVEKVELVFTPNVTMFEGVRRSAEHLVFLPAVKNGKPVTTWHKVDYGFQITLVPF